MNKTDLIQKIKQLEGITPVEQSYLIDLINSKKKYGLVWEEKSEDVEEQLRTYLPVLSEAMEKRILADPATKKSGPGTKKSEPGFAGLKDYRDLKKSKPVHPSLFGEDENPDIPGNQINHDNQTNHSSDNFEASSGVEAPNHILIEGDNLHALTALSFSHEGRIDVIYIDPPYNTGNKDFKYNDTFVDKEDGYRHSKWLSFMEKRLRIAKVLMSPKGVIFISIDDNEQAQLKMLCDLIFGEENYVGDCIWKRRASSGLSNFKFSKDHEYVKIYKSIGFHDFTGITKTYEKYLNPDNDERGEWIADNLTVGMGRDQRPNQYYVLVNPETGMEYQPNPNRVWAYIPESMAKLISEKRIIFPKSKTKRPMLKRFRNELRITENPISSLLNTNFNIGLNSEGTRTVQDFGLNGSFVYPKPNTLIKNLIQIYKGKATCILDFFAGSGTTLHATMQLNAEDGGNRQCILVTNNENNICEEVTYERNRRVIQGYTNSKGEWVQGLTNNNLRYYKTELVPGMTDETNKRLLAKTSTDLLCIKEDCYTDLTESAGFNPVQCTIFSNGCGKYLIVVYHSRKQL